jgi:hypothetical protein
MCTDRFPPLSWVHDNPVPPPSNMELPNALAHAQTATCDQRRTRRQALSLANVSGWLVLFFESRCCCATLPTMFLFPFRIISFLFLFFSFVLTASLSHTAVLYNYDNHTTPCRSGSAMLSRTRSILQGRHTMAS